MLVVAHKVVSKAEGAASSRSTRARRRARRELAPRHGKDPRHVQVVLDESAELVRAERGVLICRTHHGFVCANAGVDASNAPATARSSSCPATPTPRPARCARRCPAARPSSSPTRSAAPGATGSATSRSASPGSARSTTGAGAPTPPGASCAPRGSRSPTRPRRPPTSRATRSSREPAVVVRGLERHVTDDDGPGAAALVRPRAEDLFA